MNVRKFLGENSRAVLRSVKLELGEDAVILSSRQVDEGFEVLAMAQNEVAHIAASKAPGSGSATRTAGRAAASEPQPFIKFALGRPGAKPVHPAPGVEPLVDQEATRSEVRLEASAPTARVHSPDQPANSGDGLMAELKSMRGLLESQLASIAWSESARRAPLRMKLAGELLAAGFSAALTRSVTSRLPDDFTPAQADKWLASVIESNLKQSPPDEMIERGGVYAMVGPTGVGKTTTTAKLAARYVMKYGAQKLGLVSTDSYRIGAQDQLRIYGRILGVPVHAVQDAAELHAALAALRDKHLILIDTIGVGQRDPRVADQVALLGMPRINRLLLLNAACQGETLEDVVLAYRGRGLAGCCLTKIDEAVKMGGALGCAIRHRLQLHFVSNGQRVPEDLHLPNIPYLVHRALKPEFSAAFALTDDEAGLLITPPGCSAKVPSAERQ